MTVDGRAGDGASHWRREMRHGRSHTSTLRGLVRKYSKGVGLIKEYLQNADDAGARHLHVIYDRRHHQGPVAAPGLVGELEPELAVVLGPALLFLNDSTFSPSDLESIQAIGDSGKLLEASGTGRFGLGFNCSFSVSDHPLLLTGDNLIWFDPHVRAIGAFENPTKEAASRVDLAVAQQKFPGWVRLFVAAEINLGSGSHQGTAFRLPLRSAADRDRSEILREEFVEADWTGIVQEARRLGPALLVFLRSVQRLTIDEIDASGRRRTILDIQTVNPSIVETAREPLRQRVKGDPADLLSAWITGQVPLPQAKYVHRFRISAVGEADRDELWHVVSGIREGHDGVLLHEALEICTGSQRDKVLPWAGAAVCLEREDAIGGRSCFLPLSNQDSAPPVWLHGWFDLDDSRANINTDISTSGLAERRARWNFTLMWHGVGPAWADLLELIGLELHGADAPGYALWPAAPSEDVTIQSQCSRGFYEQAISRKLIHAYAGAEPVLVEATTDPVRLGRMASSALSEALLAEGWQVVRPLLPKRVVDGLREAGAELALLTPSALGDYLRVTVEGLEPPWSLDEVPTPMLRRLKWLNATWSFCRHQAEVLLGTPTCLTRDGHLHRWGDDWVYFGSDSQQAILRPFPELSVEVDCLEALGLRAMHEDLMLSHIEICDIETFASLLVDRKGDVGDRWATAVLRDIRERPSDEVERDLSHLQRTSLVPFGGNHRSPLGLSRTAMLVDVKAEGVPVDALRKVGVRILDARKALTAAAVKLRKAHSVLIPNVTPATVVDQLVAAVTDEPGTVLDALDKLHTRDLESLLDFLAPWTWRGRPPKIRGLKEALPLPTTDGRRVRASDPDVYRQVGDATPPAALTVGVSMVRVDRDRWPSLMIALGVPPLDDFRLVMDQALPRLADGCCESDYVEILRWLVPAVVGLHASLERPADDAAEDKIASLMSCLAESPLLPLDGGTRGSPLTSYWPQSSEQDESLRKVLGADVPRVASETPVGVSPALWTAFLSLLDVPGDPRISDLVLAIRRAVEAWSDDRNEAEKRLRSIFGYFNHEQRWEQIRDAELAVEALPWPDNLLQWVALAASREGRGVRLREVLPVLPWTPIRVPQWTDAPSIVAERLHEPGTVYSPESARLVSAVEPVAAIGASRVVAQLRADLGMKVASAKVVSERGDLGVLWRQLLALWRVDIEALDDSQIADFMKTIDAVFQELSLVDELDELLDDVGDERSPERFLVPIQRRWVPAGRVFFNQLPVMRNPWVVSLEEGWPPQKASAHRTLHEAVGVRSAPSLEDWQRVLAGLDAESDGAPMTGDTLVLARRALQEIATAISGSPSDSPRASANLRLLDTQNVLCRVDECFISDVPRVTSLGECVVLPLVAPDENSLRVARWAGVQSVSSIVRFTHPSGDRVKTPEWPERVHRLLTYRSHPSAGPVAARIRFHYTAPDERPDLAGVDEWALDADEVWKEFKVDVYRDLRVTVRFEGVKHERLEVPQHYLVDDSARRIHISFAELEDKFEEALVELLCPGFSAEPAKPGKVLAKVARRPEAAAGILDTEGISRPPEQSVEVEDVEPEPAASWPIEAGVDAVGDEEDLELDSVGDDGDEVDDADEADEADVEDEARSEEPPPSGKDATSSDAVRSPAEAASPIEGNDAGVSAGAVDEQDGTKGDLPPGREVDGEARRGAEGATEDQRHDEARGRSGEPTGGGPDASDAHGRRAAGSGNPDGGRSADEPVTPTAREERRGKAGQPRRNGHRKVSQGWDPPPKPRRSRGTGGQSESRTGRGTKLRKKPRVRMKSYVEIKGLDERHRALENWEAKHETGRTGEEEVLRFERRQGRVPEQMPTNNKGYDIYSVSGGEEGGEHRYIEVKATDGDWNVVGVGVSRAQFDAAMHFEEDWWLYVVEIDRKGKNHRVHPFRNPFLRTDIQFRFDDQWKRLPDPNVGGSSSGGGTRRRSGRDSTGGDRRSRTRDSQHAAAATRRESEMAGRTKDVHAEVPPGSRWRAKIAGKTEVVTIASSERCKSSGRWMVRATMKDGSIRGFTVSTKWERLD